MTNITIEERTKARELLYKKIDSQEIDLIETVKLIRKILGLSQVAFAKKVGVSKMSITNLESGIGNPTFKNINKILAPMKLELKIGRK